ncbi:MAG: hypothetical protein AB9907_04500 [Flexilinea sp.]
MTSAGTALIENDGTIFVTDYESGNLYEYTGTPDSWEQIGNSAQMFAIDGKNQLYSLAPDGESVWKWTGKPME